MLKVPRLRLSSILYSNSLMRLLKKLWSVWKILAHKIGLFQSRAVLTIFYFVILAPVGVIKSFFADDLHLKNTPRSTWQLNRQTKDSLSDLTKQY